ncbi:N-acetylglucosamine-6-phosphate deacetylase [Paenibacillus sp. GCM10023252]|uniref:N-acetylglucosamine-6-phosphate deacetylase n=1 Tax=Paenibacillus sp. GCM10023252 TaxID=3252649 RepID=UPI003608CBA7
MKDTANAVTWIIHNVKIVMGDEWQHGSVTVVDGRIHRIAEQGEPETDLYEESPELVLDGQGGWLMPGFIDVHVHGGFGSDFMDASKASYDTITKFHAAHGTTGMLATTVTASPEAIEAVLAASSAYRQGEMPYAELLGVHLEGPFISSKWPGAQNPSYIVEPRIDWLRRWTSNYPDLVRMLTLAPENEGALEAVAWLAGHGIVAACGHTDATYEQLIKAVDEGLSHAVHTYNAMRGLHHREPGTVGAVLTENRVSAEIIADGEHAHPAAIRLLVSAKPSDKLLLITDAISAAGMADGAYDLGGLPVTVHEGVARLTQGGALAGSSLTMIQAFRYMLEHTGLSVPEVSRLASGNAAKLLGISEATGSIALGKQADLILVDSALSLRSTWVRGRQVYNAQEGAPSQGF